MSGGSYDYAYHRLQELAGEIRARAQGNAARLAFAAHLMKCAEAARAIEWVDSADYGPGDEMEAIREVLSPGAELEQLLTDARELSRTLAEALARIDNERG